MELVISFLSDVEEFIRKWFLSSHAIVVCNECRKYEQFSKIAQIKYAHLMIT